MDKFVKKKVRTNTSHKSENVSAKDRVKQYSPGVLYEDGGLCFCAVCNRALDYTRKSTIDNHLKSDIHRHRKEQKDIDSEQNKRQKTMTTMFKMTTSAQESRIEVSS